MITWAMVAPIVATGPMLADGCLRKLSRTNSKRPSLLKLRADLTRKLYAFLQHQGKMIVGQIIVLRSRFNKSDNSPQEQDAIDRIIAGIDFTGWAVLPAIVQPLVDQAANDGSIHALIQVDQQFVERVAKRGGRIRGMTRERYQARSERIAARSQEDSATDNAIYADGRAAEMVGMRRDELGRLTANPEAKWAITESTRDGIRQYVESAITEGWSNEKLAHELGNAYAFSKERSMVIARTETNMASNRGALNGYKASGVVSGVEWLTADDDSVSPECAENGDAGVVPVGSPFPSGDDSPPVHPNCRCTLSPVVIFDTSAEADSGENDEQP